MYFQSHTHINLITDQNEMKYVEFFSYFGTRITNDGRRKREIKSRIAAAKSLLLSPGKWI